MANINNFNSNKMKKIIICIAAIGLLSCSSLHKTLLINESKTDSSIVVKKDSSGAVKIDSISKKNDLTISDKSIIDNSEDDIDIEFYPPIYDTNKPTTPSHIFIKDSAGGKVIEANNPIKSVKQKQSKSSIKNDIQTSIIIQVKKFNYEETYKKLFDENLCLIKESYIKETEKKKWSFSWLWLLLLLIPAGYYGFKWIKKNYTINI